MKGKTKAGIGFAALLAASLFSVPNAEAQRRGPTTGQAAPRGGAEGYAVPRMSQSRIPPGQSGRAVPRRGVPQHWRQFAGGVDRRSRGFSFSVFYSNGFPYHIYQGIPGYIQGPMWYPLLCGPRFLPYDAIVAAQWANVSRPYPPIGAYKRMYNGWGQPMQDPSVQAGDQSPVNIGGDQTVNYTDPEEMKSLREELESARRENQAFKEREAERRGYERGLSDASPNSSGSECPECPASASSQTEEPGFRLEEPAEEKKIIRGTYKDKICTKVQYISEAKKYLDAVFEEVEEHTGARLTASVGGAMQNPYILIRGPENGRDVIYVPKIDILQTFKDGMTWQQGVAYVDSDVLEPMNIYRSRDYPEIEVLPGSVVCR